MAENDEQANIEQGEFGEPPLLNRHVFEEPPVLFPQGANLPLNHMSLNEAMRLIGPFNGRNPSGLDDFLEAFRDMRNLLQWDNPTAMLVLKCKLEGEAKTYYNTIKRQVVLPEDLIRLLRERFTVDENESAALHKLMHFRQTPQMSVAEFIHTLTDLSYRAFPDEQYQAVRDRMALKVALSNMLPEIKRGVIRRNPENINDLKAAALLEERAYIETRAPTNPFLFQEQTVFSAVSEQTRCQALERRVEELSEKLDRMLNLSTNVHIPHPSANVPPMQYQYPPPNMAFMPPPPFPPPFPHAQHTPVQKFCDYHQTSSHSNNECRARRSHTQGNYRGRGGNSSRGRNNQLN